MDKNCDRLIFVTGVGVNEHRYLLHGGAQVDAVVEENVAALNDERDLTNSHDDIFIEPDQVAIGEVQKQILMIFFLNSLYAFDVERYFGLTKEGL